MMEYRSLAGRIREYLTDVDRMVERAVRFAAEANQTGEDAYWDAVALNLHNNYSGVERILEEVARTAEGLFLMAQTGTSDCCFRCPRKSRESVQH
jgi:hypothetical protein